jgi:predicted nuclease of restriction endonuclease-like RecB superfamily
VVLLPNALLSLSTKTQGDEIVPHYLTERDYTWLRALLDEYARLEGCKRSELTQRLQEPLPAPAPKNKLRMAARVLDSITRDRPTSVVPPDEARWRVFRAAAATSAGRDQVVAAVATEMGVGPGDVEASLFADLRGERRIPALPKDLSPPSLALKTNLALASSLIRRAETVRIVAFGNTRALVRHARLVGLICNVSQVATERRLASGIELRRLGLMVASDDPLSGAVLDISGPLALFHHTEVYGRGLVSLVPRLAWCDEFELTAHCAVGRGKYLSRFVLRSGDPIGTGEELARYDSRLEERFATQFRRAAHAWDVVREARPIDVGGALVFPDFELVHRREPSRRWLLEIVGFWTPDYLKKKLESLRAAGLSRLILCIDERRSCDDQPLPEDPRVIRYKRRIDPRAVLAVLEGEDRRTLNGR